MNAKPFLKWAGGKTQLIDQIKTKLPDFVYKEKFTYIEPFVGSGAMLFWVLANFKNAQKVVINDINTDLIDTYKVIRDNPHALIQILEKYQNQYHAVTNEEEKKEYYYAKRDEYNQRNSSEFIQSALFIFLNRTCFNGLYRVNKNNLFNVPIGSYKKPLICNTDNLLQVSSALQNIEILNGDFEDTLQYANNNTFFYLDPPYKPLNKTSNFNSYSFAEFNDSEQYRLKRFCDLLTREQHSWVLSNSDVKSTDNENNFFDELYAEFKISRVLASRYVNANPDKRGKLTELLISN